jgi:[acyl-carrier-protein] S-malonyltransferase
VTLVSERGKMMQAATPAGSGGMAAVIGLEDPVLEEICEKAAQGQVVSCANYNSPGQTVVAGDRAAVERVCELATESGARAAIPLSVSVPSHCALMRPAAEQLEQLLSTVKISVPAIPVVHNVDVSVHPESDAVRKALALQLWQPVRWSSTIQWLASQGVGQFAECGPGKVLAGLNRRISRELKTVALIDYATISETVESWS